jgi:hypothetical protein
VGVRARLALDLATYAVVGARAYPATFAILARQRVVEALVLLETTPAFGGDV